MCVKLKSATTGQTVLVRGTHSTPYNIGVCEVAVFNGATQTPLTPTDIVFKADNGANPLINGTLSLYSASRWTIEGLDFTSNILTNSMLQMVSGDGWRITNCEFFGGGGFTQLGVNHGTPWGDPSNWQIYHNYLHDNPGNPAHQTEQDHLIYVITGNSVDSNGQINDNLFVGAPHGAAVKIGSTALSDGDGSRGIVFKNNTIVNGANNGQTLLLATRTYNIQVENNLISATDPNTSDLSGVYNVALGSWGGSGITASNNLLWGYLPNNIHGTRAFLMSTQNPITGQTSYSNIDLNVNTSYLTQVNNVRIDPGYPVDNCVSKGCASYPRLNNNTISYGVNGCPLIRD